MAEVKSALEIALERAAALGKGEDDSKRQAQKKGQALARQCLEGDLSPQAMANELAGLGGESTTAAAKTLLEALAEERPGALPALEALCAGGEAQQGYEALSQADTKRQQARRELDKKLAQGMLTDLVAQGISGSAVQANPVAHPDYQAQCDAALAGARAELDQAGQALLKALA